MDIFYALILGVVEGITEFLPVSSTAHLILTARVMGLDQTSFLKTFEIAIQLGAILAVVVLYWKKLLVDWEIFKRVCVAFIPTAVIGFALYAVIKNYLFDSHGLILWSLFLGGIFLVIFDRWYKEASGAVDDLTKISFRQAFCIGLYQSLAVVPGVSRAAATIVGGLLLGVNRKTIVEFSFLLAVPTMLAATCLDLMKNAKSFSSDQMGFLLVGFVSSFVVAVVSIKFLLHFIKNNGFLWFGIYRILVAFMFWFVL